MLSGHVRTGIEIIDVWALSATDQDETGRIGKVDKAVEAWRKSGDYLPGFLRDFHDQKDTFKAMHDMIDTSGDYIKNITWVSGQCYVIDIFLWHMARHGYVLQKTHKRGKFDDIYETTKAANDKARAAMARAMGLTPVDTHQN